MSADRIALGPFAFDPAAGRLTRDGAAVPLSGRALAVLTALAAAAGTVTKEALLTAAWPGVIVEEGNLTVQVAALRKLLGEEAIVTVPRIGYRLRRGSAVEAPVLPRLGVMPFQTIGGDPDGAYFADGITEDIITALGRFRGFVVVSRQAAFSRRDGDPAAVAAEFGLAYLVTGSLRRSGDSLRLSARLIETRTGAQLWARTFDGTAEDVFAFQDHLTEAVVGALAPEVEAAEIRAALANRPASVAAYDLYLRALAETYRESDESFRQAVDLLERALVIEPRNPLYLSLAGRAYGQRVAMAMSPLTADDSARAISLARAALQAGPPDAASMAQCSGTLIHHSDDYEFGLELMRRALSQNPNNIFATIWGAIAMLHCGDLAECARLSRRAIDLGPADPVRHLAICALAHAAVVTGHHDEAIQLATQALAVKPSFPPSLWMLAAAHAHLGNLAEATRWRKALQALTPGASVARIRAGQPKMKPERIEPVLAGLALAGLPEV